MKSFRFLVFAILLFSSTYGSAGNPPREECINVGNTIQLRRPDIFSSEKPGLYIMVSKYDNQNHKVDQYQSFNFADITFTSSNKTVLAQEKRGCTAREVFSVKYTFKKRDAAPMPDAYNKLADEDGTLSDYFLCTTSGAWTPQPGHGCN